MYPEQLVIPMREELTRLGFRELKSVQEVDQAVTQGEGPTLLVVNSVCGCAAGSARPGVALALKAEPHPAPLVTVFAGQDQEATARARSYLKGYAPSSPSMALLKDGQVLWMLERHQIEGRDPASIASLLSQAFAKHC